jgi:hypothetical protein
MSKQTALILFVLIGLPPGLCSLSFAPETGRMLRSSGPENAFYGGLFGILGLIGFAIFAFMLGLLIRTWLRKSPS